MKQTRTPGIYSITCLPNGRVYIGSSNDMDSRIKSHKRALKNGDHKNIHLQRAYDKHGKSAFKYDVVECAHHTISMSKVDEEIELVRLENVHISRYERDSLFNIEIPATVQGFIITPEVEEKRRRNLATSFATPESKAKRSKSATEAHARPEVKALRASITSSAEFKKKASEGHRRALESDPTLKDRKLEGVRRWAKTVSKETRSENAHKFRWNTEEKRKIQSEKLKAAWESEELRQRASERMKALTATPEWKKKISSIMKARHQDPEYKARYLEAMSRKAQKGEANPNSKLKNEDVLEIRRLFAIPKSERPTIKEIADKFGVSKALLFRIRSGQTWSHVK